MTLGTIRVDPDDYPNNAEALKTTGAQGDYARFYMNLFVESNARYIRLQSKKTTKWVRIENNILSVSGGTGTADKCKWKVIQDGEWYKFQNKEHTGMYYHLFYND